MNIGSLILMILLISLLILVHELGHYAVARMCGIRVTKFGFGLPFGPTLFEKKIGETTFYIHAFLFGGYVSFPDDDEDSDLPQDSPEMFKNKTILQRSLVVVAGVVANVLCAIILVLFTAFAWGKLPSSQYDVYVTKIIAPKESSVANSKLQVGDKILTINGQKITNPMQVNFFAQASKENDGKISLESFEKNYTKLQKLNPNVSLDEVLKKDSIINLIQNIEETPINLSKSEMYGLKQKRNIDVINLTSQQKTLRDKLIGQKTYKVNEEITLKDVAIATSDSVVPLNFIVERNGEKIQLKTIYPNKEGMIGIERQYKEVYEETKGIKSGIINSYEYLYSNTSTMLWSLGQMFSGNVPLKDLHGIVAITKVGGDVIQEQGIFKGILLTAIISLNLAIINLLPIPALDGGHLLFLLIEKIRGRAVDEKTLEKIASAGFYLLIILMVVIIFNDIAGLITKKF